MIRRSITGFAIIVFMLLLGRAASAADEPPDLEKGWNLVSVPCDVAVSDLKKADIKDLEVFGWKDGEYYEAETLERGRGYMVNLNSVLNPSSLCTGQDVSDEFIMQLEKGWNLIGNPFHKSVSVSALLGDTGAKAMYEYRGNRYVKLEMGDNVKPWRGFWVYLPVSGEVVLEEECALEVEAFTDADKKTPLDAADPSISPEDTLYMSAVYTCKTAAAVTAYEDVTLTAAWSYTSTGVGKVVEGAFVPAAMGSVGITAHYENITSDTISVIVISDDFACRKLVVVSMPGEHKFIGEGEGFFRYGTKMTLPNEVRYRDVQQCRMCSPDGGYSCNSHSYLSEGMSWNEKGTDMQMRAFCTDFGDGGSSGRKIDVTEMVEWSVENDEILALGEKGKVTTKAVGGTVVYASMDGVKSKGQIVSVEESSVSRLFWYSSPVGATSCYYSPLKSTGCDYYMSKDTQIEQRVKAEIDANGASYFDFCDTRSNIDFARQRRYLDVTDFVEWSFDSKGKLEHVSGGVFNAVESGTVTMRASWVGQKTDEREFRIVDTTEPLSIELSPSSVQTLLIGEKLTFTAFANYLTTDSDCNDVNYRNRSSCLTVNKDITDVAQWTLENPDGIDTTIDGGILAGGDDTGSVTVSASYQGLSSADVSVDVVDGDGIYALIMYPAGVIELPKNAVLDFRVTVYTNAAIQKCGSYKTWCGGVDVTDSVQWNVEIVEGDVTFNAGRLDAGEVVSKVKISATYKEVTSDVATVNVKDIDFMVLKVNGDNYKSLYNCPYESCFFSDVGKNTNFTVTGKQDSYYWSKEYDLTSKAEWEISDESIAEIKPGGEFVGKKSGMVWIRASVGDARSAKVWVLVLGGEDHEYLMIGINNYNSLKPVQPLRVGLTYSLTAMYYKLTAGYTGTCKSYWAYDYSDSSSGERYICPGEGRKLTATTVTKSSSMEWFTEGDGAGIAQAASFKGTEPGFVDVYATYNNVTSNTVTIDVWEPRAMELCDSENPNITQWEDEQTAADLDTDCASYAPGETVKIRYTAYIKSRWYLDNCLDLYVMDTDDNIVRTFREEGCSTEDLTRSSNRAAQNLVYQAMYEWDMKDDFGNTLPSGTYYAVARFYILWEPVLRLPFTIQEAVSTE